MSQPRPSTFAGDDRGPRQLRSKGLLPALGVGAAVYFVTGMASLSTLGMVGIGAGVGYGVGSWIADKLSKRDSLAPGATAPAEQLPWAVQVALQSWQDFANSRAAGRQLGPDDMDALWAEFEHIEPTHAKNAAAIVRGPRAPPTGPRTIQTSSGATLVATATSDAAEV
eukprot:TRINITY_DN38672_c0_g1_i1.p1 TRINITY_DN38672_c0_g1~~TRINITY_DN38672_c0_g1_i1.p1  ORF type:complete len:168 (-),score=24.85 TRINITY_DN38672_c0_g1_i1:67-570(-)